MENAFGLFFSCVRFLGALLFALAGSFAATPFALAGPFAATPFAFAGSSANVIPFSLAVYFERVILFSLTVSSALATAFVYDSFVTCSCFGVDTFWRSARFLAFLAFRVRLFFGSTSVLEYP